jgi:hypothetical protein
LLPPPLFDKVPRIDGAPDAAGTFLPARFFAPADHVTLGLGKARKVSVSEISHLAE